MYMLNCWECGKELESHQMRRVTYCSAACKQHAYRRRRAVRDLERQLRELQREDRPYHLRGLTTDAGEAVRR